MTAVTSSRRRPRVVSIFLYTLQSCLPPKRWFALMFPCAGALMFGLIARAIDLSRERAFGEVGLEGLFSLIVPIAALNIIKKAIPDAFGRGWAGIAVCPVRVNVFIGPPANLLGKS
jgi:hypothetical protein